MAARARWSGGRGRLGIDPAYVARARAHVRTLDRPFTRADLDPLVDPDHLPDLDPRYFPTPDTALRFVSGRMIWGLSNEGLVCHGPQRGSEGTYVPRHVAFPDHPAPEPRDSLEAAARLTRRYLRAYGPATPQDEAHFFGATVREARAWLEALREELVEVPVDGVTGWLLADDLPALRDAPAGPPRLLPAYDNLLMGHADKSWTVRAPGEEKAVWRKAAVVAAVVLVDGLIVATWTHKARARAVDITIEPLSGWQPELLAALEAEAAACAAHLGRDEARLLTA